MLEKHIERKVCDYAKNKGWLVYKFTSPARAAVPDRLLIDPNGQPVFLEFKQTGKKATVPQVREMQRLRSQNCCVAVVDNVEDGVALIDSSEIRDVITATGSSIKNARHLTNA